MTQWPQEQGDRDAHAEGVPEEERHEGPRPVHIGDETADHAANPNPQVQHGEVDPKELGAQRAVDQGRDHRLKGWPTRPKRDPEQREGHDECRHGGRERQQRGGRDLNDVPPQQDLARADPIHQRADRPGDEEGHDRDDPHEGAGDIQVNAAHFIHVDDRERQGQAAADGREGRGRQQPAGRNGELLPEAPQRDLLGLGHGPTLAHGSDGPTRFSWPRSAP